MAIQKKGRWLCLFPFLCFASLLYAGTTGKISGRVTEGNTGLALPGVNVLIVGTDRGAATDINGFYQIINLPPGKYTMEISMMGYSKVTVRDVRVSVDKTTRQNITLSREVIEGEEVVVVAERPLVEKDRTNTTYYVNSETIQELPVTSMQEIVELQAGVITGSNGELHFRGGREREVAYMIDGVSVSNSYSQSGGKNVPIENAIIQELQIISGTFNAEYGSAQSGIINVVTKSIQRDFHGGIQFYSGDYLSNKTNTFIGIDQINPIAEYDLQAHLSGPIFGNKLGFFATVRYNSPASYLWYERRFNPIDGWVIDAYKKWFTEHNASEITKIGEITIPDSLSTGDGELGPLMQSKRLTATGKLTFIPSSAIKLSYTLIASYSKSKSGNSSRRYQPDALATNWGYSDHHFLNFRHLVTENFFYNLNLSYQHNHGKSYYRMDNKIADFPGDEGIQPISSSSSNFSLGRTDGGYWGKEGKNYRKLYIVSGNVNWQIDNHNFIKAGFEAKQHRINTYSYPLIVTEDWERYRYTTAINGADYSWSEYWNLMVDYWKDWKETYGTTKYRYPEADEVTRYRDYTIKPLEAAFYIQDKLEMGEIVLNGGLRLDLFKPNEKVVINKRIESYLLGSSGNLKEASTQYQLSPRFGLSFPISDKGAFHVAYGHFFQMPSFEKMYSEPLQVLTPIQLEGKFLGNAELKPERTVAYEVGLQQEITSEYAVDLTVFYKDFRNQLGIESVTTVDLVTYTHYVNRDYGNVKGFTLALEKLQTGLLSGAIDYTFQYAEGSASSADFIQLVQVASRIGGEPIQFVERQILPLDWDQRHTINLTAILSKPGNWSISTIGSAGSGLPYSPTSVTGYQFPDTEFKNTARKPIRWNFDIRAKKHFRLSSLDCIFFVNIENLFDHINQKHVYTTSGRADENAMLPEEREIRDTQLTQINLFAPEEVDNRPQWYTAPRMVQIGLGVNF
ncbi:TonB-dependent receptor plug domain-containing protein [candidate division KSB1 bacterium]|nr:TonB-dependent receptor plug domain-containing protein [candidate division KSB1 bacterium]